ncbi:MAG: patatin-like phospholipase family protein [Candidatus Kapaibacteriota bacterium]
MNIPNQGTSLIDLKLDKPDKSIMNFNRGQTFIIAFLLFFNTLLFGKEIEIDPNELEVKIGLALSGGGSRGIAQIGVLKVFEKEKIPIYAIAGTSIGAFVGGLYAIGYSSEEMEAIALETNWENVLSILKEQERSELFFDQKLLQDRTFATLRFKRFKFVYPQALSLGWKFNSFVQKLVWNGAYYSNNFDKLKVPFRAVATDVGEGKTISIGKGNLITALRASSAIPLLNTPVNLDTMILVDGGLFANLPVEQVKEFSPDLVIGVNTTSPLKDKSELNKPWNLASQIISIYMNKYFEKSLQKADFVIIPPIGSHPNDNFKGLDSLIRIGEESAYNSVSKIKKLIQIKKDSIIKLTSSKIKEELSLDGLVYVEKISNYGTDQQNEFYNLTKNRTDLSLEEFLKNIDKESTQKILFKTKADGTTTIEILKYPKIDSIKCKCNIPNSTFSLDSITSKFIGEHDCPTTRKKIVERLKKYFASQGFSFVKIAMQPSIYSNIVNISIEPNRIGKIEIDPNVNTSEYIIRREITFKEGDYTNSEKIVQSWKNIISSGLFSDVFIDFTIDTAKSTCDLFISARERGTQVLNLIFCLDNEKNIQGGGDFIHENLFNSGTRLLISVTGCKTDFLPKINITQPRIWNTDFTVSLDAFYYYREVPIFLRKITSTLKKYEIYEDKNFATERFSFQITGGKQIERLGNLFVGIKLERQRYYEFNELTKPNFYNINNFFVGLAYDSRDKAQFSTSGRLINLLFESKLFDSKNSASFSRAIFFHSNNFAIKDFVIRPNVLFGFADEGLPFPDFFSLGGEGNFFGYRQDESLGRQIFNARFDVQYRLPFKFYFDTYLTLSYNIGSTWSQFEVIRIADLKHGLGFSIGFDTPIGPVHFSVGNAFYFIKNPNATVWGPLQLYFSIGNKLF